MSKIYDILSAMVGKINSSVKVEEQTNAAQVGQTVAVKAVDENGKPTEWKTVDFPEPVTSWDDLKNKPFEDTRKTEEVAIEWDGNTEGLVSVMLLGEPTLYKVSDLTPPSSDVLGGKIRMLNGKEPTVDESDISECEDGYSIVFPAIVVANKPNATLTEFGMDFVFPEAGTYFFHTPNDHVCSLTSTAQTGELKTLDEKYIPDSIARVEDIPEPVTEWDDIGKKQAFEPIVFDTNDLSPRESVDLGALLGQENMIFYRMGDAKVSGAEYADALVIENDGDNPWISSTIREISIDIIPDGVYLYEISIWYYDNAAQEDSIQWQGYLIVNNSENVPELQSGIYLHWDILKNGHKVTISKETTIPLPEKYLPTSIPVIQSASAGQTVAVKAVDENGKPTEWETVDFPEGGGIIDVIELPTEGIAYGAFYRVPVGEFVVNGNIFPEAKCIFVDELPEVGEPFFSSMTGMKLYYNRTDGTAHGYIDEAIAQEYGFEVGWYNEDEMSTKLSFPFGGVIELLEDDPKDGNPRLLLTNRVYAYNGGWREVATAYKLPPLFDIGWDGDMTGRYALDLSSFGYDGVYLVKMSDDIFDVSQVIGAQITLSYGEQLIVDESYVNTTAFPGTIQLGDGAVAIVYSSDDLNTALGLPSGTITNGTYFMYIVDDCFVSKFTAPSKVKKIDPKFLPETDPVLSWNDLIDRPFGIETTTVNITGMKTINFTNGSAGSIEMMNVQFSGSFIEGDIYYIEIDSEIYECVCIDNKTPNPMFPGTYNHDYVLNPTSNHGVKYSRSQFGISSLAAPHVSDGAHEVAFYHVTENIIHLDEKFIPGTVPVIQSAKAGQVVSVTSVDTNGKPTAWGVADLFDSGSVRFDKIQTLTTAQQQNARTNINVYSKTEVDSKIASVDLSEYPKTTAVETMIEEAIGAAIGGSY